MNRPDQVYLPEPIELNGIRISHTLEGTKYKLELLKHCRDTATKNQLDDSARKHLNLCIENFEIRLQLMEKQTNKTTNQKSL